MEASWLTSRETDKLAYSKDRQPDTPFIRQKDGKTENSDLWSDWFSDWVSHLVGNWVSDWVNERVNNKQVHRGNPLKKTSEPHISTMYFK